MRAESDCDILVVGAGPAGCCAAGVAAREGACTVLIDSKQRIGEQPHCGEFVPLQLFSELGLDRASIIQSVDFMETLVTGPAFFDSSFEGTHSDTHSSAERRHEETPTCAISSLADKVDNQAPLLRANRDHGHFEAGRSHSFHGAELFVRRTQTPSRGFVIDRVRFDRDLAREAAASGATVMSSSRLVRTANGVWTVRTGGNEAAFRPRFVIAGDGALSTVASLLSLPRAKILTGLQVEAPLTGPLNRTIIFLDRNLVCGYAWLFPKGRVANVGIGATFQKHVLQSAILDDFMASLRRIGMIRHGVLARSAGVIPVSGLRDSLVVGKVIFCGDAAGLTHPITGAGIPQAVFSGRQAGQAAVNALKTGDSNHLNLYEEEIRGRYEGIIRHALAKRRLMTGNWDTDVFEALCEETWIGFKGYRKRVR